MVRLFKVILSIVVFISIICSYATNNEMQRRMKRNCASYQNIDVYKTTDLYGKWIIQENKPFSIDYYPGIDFMPNNYVILRSYGDTIYTGIYKLNGQVIILKIDYTEIVLQIHSFKNDSLILSGFINTNDTLIYTKLNK